MELSCNCEESSGDFGTVSLRYEHGTGLYRFAVHGHGASAAMRGLAANVRTGLAQPFAQGVDQQFARFSQELLLLAIHGKSEMFLL